MLKNNEKFIAFVLLGMALLAMAFMLYLHPIPDSQANSGVLQILNMIIGAMIGAFGSAQQALFRSNTPSTVTVDNPPEAPVNVSEPTTPAPA